MCLCIIIDRPRQMLIYEENKWPHKLSYKWSNGDMDTEGTFYDIIIKKGKVE